MAEQSPAPTTGAVVCVADDLSGAAEAGWSLSAGGAADVLLGHGADAFAPSSTGVTVLDLDSRTRPREEARALLDAALAAALDAPRDSDPVLKVDSLLRGHLGLLADAVAAHGRTLLLCPALPAARRSFRAGSVLSAGEHGALEASDADLATRLGRPVTIVGLDDVRAGAMHLAALLRSVLRAPSDRAGDPARTDTVLAVDAETEADLDVVAAACSALAALVPAGSAGLLGAIGRRRASAAQGSAARPRTPAADGSTGPVLTVVGSAEPGARAQVARLAAHGAQVLALDPAHAPTGTEEREELAIEHAAAVRAALATTPTVLTFAPSPLDRDRSGAMVALLARTVALALADDEGRTSLVLTGGETARRVLDGLGITRLALVDQVHPGAIASHALTRTSADPGDTATHPRRVVTRPGSHGGPDSLLLAARHLGAGLHPQPTDHTRTRPLTSDPDPATAEVQSPPGGTAMTVTDTSTPTSPQAAGSPVIAVTMGDGAGVGPEVVVGALVAPELRAACRPVVIGDAARLRLAAGIMGVDVELHVIEDLDEAVWADGTIEVIDLDLLPADLPWGEVSPVAGDAAYHYIRVAAELAVAGRVHAICTAPLNKAALHAGGHVYPGHTELLADLTGTEEVSMMLSTPKVKVVHVTTHIGLIDAVAKIEPGLVERTVRRGHAALVGSGVSDPVIGVCGINPHAGENGLFGYGEEDEKIAPAISVLQEAGIDARGPLPADTAFFLAGRGDYDLIVAMYHDQGHGPVKVLGIEAGVNITVGLPVIRTSVDHGTAFDIAGTGKAEIGSMIEAMRQATELATVAG
ncbi:4-hydroxythreonine-4-phosphate dehydrogenase PdxA [Nocardioides bruguierae]|uniref:4-hydroxythreonine-4-phosphate dehydrogenase PdxA n=1 Tax=Nocardioides bruguierae TaxID=2945102 RepID=UPI0020223FF5|nr:4-hydroxythreonine-4-phosphate dehydrogenase PdxA [Nocardioides bruguierae]MCL8026100.1 4-hydroxythreonine-4-phosphate dehydrogenase PdxA [Nocardioides bruguierae]